MTDKEIMKALQSLKRKIKLPKKLRHFNFGIDKKRKGEKMKAVDSRFYDKNIRKTF